MTWELGVGITVYEVTGRWVTLAGNVERVE